MICLHNAEENFDGQTKMASLKIIAEQRSCPTAIVYYHNPVSKSIYLMTARTTLLLRFNAPRLIPAWDAGIRREANVGSAITESGSPRVDLALPCILGKFKP